MNKLSLPDEHRLIILDTETTGLDETVGKIFEIGCVEIDSRTNMPTGRDFHTYLDPDGVAIEGKVIKITNTYDSMLRGKPKFKEILPTFLKYIGNSPIIAHNSSHDEKFLRKEILACGVPMISNTFIDTLPIARQMFPGKRCSLDALCKRFNINNEIRGSTGHGALLDAKILAKVWYFLNRKSTEEDLFFSPSEQSMVAADFSNFVPRLPIYTLTLEEEQAHEDIIARMKKNSK